MRSDAVAGEARLELQWAFPCQEAFLSCPKRYVVACSGVKAGESRGGAMYAVLRLIEKPGVRGLPSFNRGVQVVCLRRSRPQEARQPSVSSGRPRGRRADQCRRRTLR